MYAYDLISTYFVKFKRRIHNINIRIIKFVEFYYKGVYTVVFLFFLPNPISIWGEYQIRSLCLFVYVSVCLCFQWFLSDNRFPLLARNNEQKQTYR